MRISFLDLNFILLELLFSSRISPFFFIFIFILHGMMDYHEGKNIIRRRWKSEFFSSFQEIEFYYYAAFFFIGLIDIDLLFLPTSNSKSLVEH